MNKKIGWIMIIVGVAGLIYLVSIFSSLVASDVAHTNAGDIILISDTFSGAYAILCSVLFIGIGVMRLKEKVNNILDGLLTVLVCFPLILFLLNHFIYS